jgi:hypothetical protein
MLAGIPVRDAELRVGTEDRDWGHTATMDLTLTAAMPTSRPTRWRAVRCAG